jgi:hypothetical protein
MMGRAVIKSYKEDWLPNKKQIDRIIEDMVMSGKWLQDDIVQGGEKVPAAERLLQIKENNREYISLVRKIERMAKILEGMSDEQILIVESYHWKGVPWYECAKVVCKSRTRFFDSIYRIEEFVGAKWEGDDSIDDESRE